MKRRFMTMVVLLSMIFVLTACKDKTYSGLYITENASTIYDLCRIDSTFTDAEAKEIADILANNDFKKIKKTKEYTGGTEKKIVITDANGMGYVILLSNNQVIAVQADGGQNVYIRTIQKQK